MTDQQGPFAKFMELLGRIGSVIALSSLTQTWLSDILAWQGFLAVVFDTYRSMTSTVLQFLTGWLPFNVPLWVADYLLIGGVYLGSLSIAYGHRVSFLENMRVLFLWPPMLSWTVLSALTGRGPSDPFMEKYVVQWMLTVIAGTALLLSINGLLPD